MLRKIEGKWSSGWQRIWWLDSITNSMDMNLSKFLGIVNRGAWSALIHGVAKNPTRLSNWTTTTAMHILYNDGLAVLCVCVCVRARAHTCSIPQWRLTLCDPMDCSPPGSSVHGVFQTRTLEGVSISLFRGPSWTRDRTLISLASPTLAGRFFTTAHLGSPIPGNNYYNGENL